MSTALAVALLGWPVLVLVTVVVLLVIIGRAAAGERFRWPWSK